MSLTEVIGNDGFMRSSRSMTDDLTGLTPGGPLASQISLISESAENMKC